MDINSIIGIDNTEINFAADDWNDDDDIGYVSYRIFNTHDVNDDPTGDDFEIEIPVAQVMHADEIELSNIISEHVNDLSDEIYTYDYELVTYDFYSIKSDRDDNIVD
jgi:hypothetical protein